MASAPPAMIIPATAILAALADVARCRSVMNWLSSLVAPALQEQRRAAGPDLRARLAPSRARRHLDHAQRAAPPRARAPPHGPRRCPRPGDSRRPARQWPGRVHLLRSV